MDYKTWDQMNTLEKYTYVADWAKYHADKVMQGVNERDFDDIRFEFSELKHYVGRLEKLIGESEDRLRYGEGWDE